MAPFRFPRGGARLLTGVTLLVLLWSGAAWALQATPTQILADPDRYDGHDVTVVGAVMNLKSRVSGAGNTYYTFELSDGGRAVTAFAFGTAPCRNGSRATIDGVFQKVKRQGSFTFYNQIDIKNVNC